MVSLVFRFPSKVLDFLFVKILLSFVLVESGQKLFEVGYVEAAEKSNRKDCSLSPVGSIRTARLGGLGEQGGRVYKDLVPNLSYQLGDKSHEPVWLHVIKLEEVELLCTR